MTEYEYLLYSCMKNFYENQGLFESMPYESAKILLDHEKEFYSNLEKKIWIKVKLILILYSLIQKKKILNNLKILLIYIILILEPKYTFL